MSADLPTDAFHYLLYFSQDNHFMTLVYFYKADPSASTAHSFKATLTVEYFGSSYDVGLTDTAAEFTDAHFVDHVTGTGYFAGYAR